MSDPVSPDSLLQTSIGHHQAGRIAEALKGYLSYLNTRPGVPDVLYLAGTAGFQLGNFDLARSYLEQAVELNPGHAAALNNLSIVLREQNQFQKSVEYARRALAIDPVDANAHNNLGLSLKLLGDLGGASEALREAVRLRPELPEAHLNLANTFRLMGQPQEAEKHARLAVQYAPGQSDALLTLGNLLFDEKRFEAAAMQFGEIVDADPGNGTAWFNLGCAQDETGQSRNKVLSWLKAICFTPGHDSVYQGLSMPLTYLSQDIEVQEQIRECARNVSQHPLAAARFALMLGEGDGIEQARSVLNKAKENHGRVPALRLCDALLALLSGQTIDAGELGIPPEICNGEEVGFYSHGAAILMAFDQYQAADNILAALGAYQICRLPWFSKLTSIGRFWHGLRAILWPVKKRLWRPKTWPQAVAVACSTFMNRYI